MIKIFRFYGSFVDSFNLLRKESGITIKQLCKDSHVSTRTYAKFVKKKTSGPTVISVCSSVVSKGPPKKKSRNP